MREVPPLWRAAVTDVLQGGVRAVGITGEGGIRAGNGSIGRKRRRAVRSDPTAAEAWRPPRDVPIPIFH